MTLPEEIRAKLESGVLRDNLAPLFYETLGWGASRRAILTLPGDEATFKLTPLAELGGMQVFHLEMPEGAKLPDATDRRTVHKFVSQTAQEHLIVYTTADGKQAQFVSAQTLAGGKTELRTLPFNKGLPGRTTFERLAKLNFSSSELDSDGNAQISQVKDKVDSAFDVRAVTDDFFKDYKDAYEKVVLLLEGVKGDKRLYVQRLMNRLMFLQFLARKGWMKFNGSTDYLVALWNGRDRTQSFWAAHVIPLFFTGLNNPQAFDLSKNNPAMFARIGKVPYLNGGLFEQAKFDAERDIPADNAGETVPDEAFDLIINGLFSKYNFTIHESTPLNIEVAVDPEMLGNVFEKLMIARKSNAAFYTPRTIVTFMCREALKGFLGKTVADAPETFISEHNIALLVDGGDDKAVSLAEAKRLLARITLLKVVDPACGSGAYLLGMMQELFALIKMLDTRAENMQARDDYQRKLSIIQNSLYGVDIDHFAINVSMLRLWLSLIVDYRDEPNATLPPLPNLDFKIECGDSLLAPDPHTINGIFRDKLIEEADTLNVKKAEFLSATGGRKDDLRQEIRDAQNQLTRTLQENGGIVPRDLFEWRVKFAEVFKPVVANSTIGGAMNFGQELAEADVPGGFHIVIANPPYGVKVDDAVRKAYFPNDPQSKDTYGLFMARAVQLLCEGGQFSYIVSDTWRTIKSHKPLRAFLLRETEVRHVIDLPDWVFDATVNTGIVTLTKKKPSSDHELIAGDLRGLDRNDWSGLESNLNIMAARGVQVQTPLYARYAYLQSLISTYENLSFFIASPKLYGMMSELCFTRLGDVGRAPHGISTGDNKKYIRVEAGVQGSLPQIEDWMRMPVEEMSKLTEREKTEGVDKDWIQKSGCFVPIEKGGESDAGEGWLPNYFAPTQYLINWAHGAIKDMRSNKGVAWKNEKYFFRAGLTFSISGIYAPTFRLNSSGVFEAKGSGVFCIFYREKFYSGFFVAPMRDIFSKASLNTQSILVEMT